MSLYQSHYIDKILQKFNYFDYRLACTPYDPNVKLFKNTGDSVRKTEYASLRYTTDCSRSNIAYAVGVLCKFTSRTIKYGLFYEKFHVVLKGYIEADWNTLLEYFKATSGYIFNIVGAVVSWISKK